MSKKSSKTPAVPATDLSHPVAHEPQSAHATPVVEKYVENRKDKAEEQVQQEQDGLSHAAQTRTVWDEWVSYRYAIL